MPRPFASSDDADGQQTAVTDARGYTTSTTFDPVGNVSTVTDANGMTTSYAYDPGDQLTTITMLNGTIVLETNTMAYDPVGNVTSSTDGNGHTTSYSYDSLNRETKVTDALGNQTTYNLDAVGDVNSIVDPVGTVVNCGYDPVHRQITTTDALTHTVTTTLDNNGNTAAVTDALGNLTKYRIDGLDQTTGIVDARGLLTTMTLYPDGDPYQVIDPNGNTTTYVENGLEQVTQINTPTGTITGSYDNAGRLTDVTDADGRTTHYTYDNNNNLTGEVWKNNSGVTQNVLTFTYDNDNNLLTAANNTGTETYTYNHLDNVQTYTDVWGPELTYTYDGAENVTQRTDSQGGTLSYIYDADNDLTSLQFSGTGSTGSVVRVDFGYDHRGQQTTITWFSNLTGTTTVAYSVYSYDTAGRLTSITDKNSGGTTLSDYNYQYNAGDLMATQTYWSQVGTTTFSGTMTYHYDATDQLLSDGTSSYSYDKNGNRTMSGYVTSTGNQLTNDGTWTYTYDSEGNTTTKTTGTGSGRITWTYSYDNANELTGAVETGSTGTLAQLTYSYDAEGDRVQQQVWTSTSGTMTTTRFAIDPVDGGNTWMDMNGSNSPIARYEFGPGTDQIVTRTEASGSYAGVGIYFTDALGSVRDIANWSGVLEDHIEYTSFGVPTESNAAAGDRFKFDGYEYDVTTGLYFVQARWYNPSTGTWLTQDPISFNGGDTNLQRYAGNDPTNLIDPSGLGSSGKSFGWPKFKNPFKGAGDMFDPSKENYGSYSNGGFASGQMFNTTPNNGTGGDLLGQYERGYSYGQRLAANGGAPPPMMMGGLPIYGNGNQNAAAAMTDGGKGMVKLSGFAASGLSMMPGAGALAGLSVAGDLVIGDYQGAALGILIPAGLRAGMLGMRGAAWAGRNFLRRPPGSCSNWQRFRSGFTRTCFAADTPLRTPEGSKPIQDFKVGDLVLSRDENSPDGTLEAKQVQEVFVRTGRVFHLHVGGQVIRTTPEHPFWVKGEGWLTARLLRPGNLLSSEDGRWLPVEDVLDTEEYATVYNLRVADYHTYFVGRWDWKFAVWAHNAWEVCGGGHAVDWKLTGPGGRRVDSGHMHSGYELETVFPAGHRPTRLEQSWFGHTEGKVIAGLSEEGKLAAGQRLLFTNGSKSPCPQCQQLMQWASETYQISIAYVTDTGNWLWSNGIRLM